MLITEPFPHYVSDDNKPHCFQFPSKHWDGWEVVYTDCFQNGKRTSRRIDKFPHQLVNLYDYLTSNSWRANLSAVFGISNLETDPTLHGGGLHVLPPGSKLSCHIDYARHPIHKDKERRLNAIAFLNSEWKEKWGGALCLCDPLGNVVKRIYPSPGRLVVFETSDLSYHAVEKVTGPVERATLAVYYLTPARPEAVRQRALFIPDREN